LLRGSRQKKEMVQKGGCKGKNREIGWSNTGVTKGRVDKGKFPGKIGGESRNRQTQRCCRKVRL